MDSVGLMVSLSNHMVGDYGQKASGAATAYGQQPAAGGYDQTLAAAAPCGQQQTGYTQQLCGYGG